MTPRSLSTLRRQLANILALVLVMGLSTTAWAAERLLSELPDGHNTVIAVDFSSMQGSPFLGQAMDWIYSNPSVGPQVRALEEKLEISLREDLETLAIVTDSPPLSAAMLTNPVEAVAGGELDTGGTTIFARGKVNAKDVMVRVSGEAEAGDFARVDNLDFHRVDDRTVAVVSGNRAYRDRIRARFGDRSGPGAAFMRAFGELERGQGLYVMTAPTLDESASSSGSAASFAAVGLKLASNVRLSVLLTLDDEESAERAVSDFEGIKTQAGANPMLGVFGLRPALTNLTISHSGSDVSLNTHMTNGEAQVLLQRVLGYLATTQQLQAPIEDTRKKDGVEADFN